MAEIQSHDLALAERFRSGLSSLGHRAADSGSPVVTVPGLGHAADTLAQAGIKVASRAGGLRASFHLYNSVADVDRTLDALSAIALSGIRADGPR